MRRRRFLFTGTVAGVATAIVIAGLIVSGNTHGQWLLGRILTITPHLDVWALWEAIKDLLNSAFFTAITGSLAGAFAGAYGGYRIVESGRIREDTLKEIRNTNAAIMVSFGICNSLLSTKQKLVKPLKDKYNIQKAALIKRLSQKEEGTLDKSNPFEFQADFQTMSLPPLAIDILQVQIFEKLSLVGRPLLLVTTLEQALHALDHALGKRNSLIESYKTISPMPQNTLISLYFGLPYSDDHVNQDYPDALEAISELTDSCIFFSYQLCKDLGEHGDNITSKFRKRFGSSAPRIAKPDFAKAEAANLMPPAEGFSDWMNMFVKKPGGIQSVDHPL